MIQPAFMTLPGSGTLVVVCGVTRIRSRQTLNADVRFVCGRVGRIAGP